MERKRVNCVRMKIVEKGACAREKKNERKLRFWCVACRRIVHQGKCEWARRAGSAIRGGQ
jgi:hypothetical protein